MINPYSLIEAAKDEEGEDIPNTQRVRASKWAAEGGYEDCGYIDLDERSENRIFVIARNEKLVTKTHVIMSADEATAPSVRVVESGG